MTELREQIARALCNKNCSHIGGADRRITGHRLDEHGREVEGKGPPHWMYHLPDADAAIAAWQAAPITDAEVEAAARAMFEQDEPGREAVAGIRRMAWEDVGEQYRDVWRDRASAAIVAYRAMLGRVG